MLEAEVINCQKCKTVLAEVAFRGWALIACRKCGFRNEVVGDGRAYDVRALDRRPRMIVRN